MKLKIQTGNNVKIGRGTIIGEEGFSYRLLCAKCGNKLTYIEIIKSAFKCVDCDWDLRLGGTWVEHQHHYGVKIEDNVDVGSLCVIDRGSVRDTTIREGTKINSHVFIGHNVIVGKHCLVGAGAKIHGSAVIGDYAFIGPGVRINSHVKVGECAVIGMGTVVMKDVPPFTKVVHTRREPLRTDHNA